MTLKKEKAGKKMVLDRYLKLNRFVDEGKKELWNRKTGPIWLREIAANAVIELEQLLKAMVLKTELDCGCKILINRVDNCVGLLVKRKCRKYQKDGCEVLSVLDQITTLP